MMSTVAMLQVAVTNTQSENFLSILKRGGVLMGPLAIMLFIAIYVFIERFYFIKKSTQVEKRFMHIIRDHIINNNVEAARIYAKNSSHVVGITVLKGIDHIKYPYEIIEKTMNNTINILVYQLERKLSILAVIGYIAPLFGFLGTIVGMFQLFYSIAETGEYTIATIAGGIYVKMISSATGLIIGLIGYLLYRWLITMVDAAAHRMDMVVSEFMDVVITKK